MRTILAGATLAMGLVMAPIPAHADLLFLQHAAQWIAEKAIQSTREEGPKAVPEPAAAGKERPMPGFLAEEMGGASAETKAAESTVSTSEPVAAASSVDATPTVTTGREN